MVTDFNNAAFTDPTFSTNNNITTLLNTAIDAFTA
jgi:hypothetical protein